jgi:hypothetical protein
MKMSLRAYVLFGFSLLVLLFSALIPRLFLEDTAHVVLPLEIRQQLWQEFWSQRESIAEYTGGTVELDDSVEHCLEVITNLRETLEVDKGESTIKAEGMENIEYEGDAGVLRLFHYFQEWSGDWNNWVDIYIDRDTQDIYYFYVSSGCQQNQEAYAGENFEELDTIAMAEQWGELANLVMRDVSWSGDPADTASVQYTGIDGLSSYVYNLKYTYYASSLYDFKVLLQ